MTDINLPPPCPLCAGPTRLKDMRKLPNGVMCFFRCLACDTEYPRLVDGDDAARDNLNNDAPGGLQNPAPRDGV